MFKKTAMTLVLALLLIGAVGCQKNENAVDQQAEQPADPQEMISYDGELNPLSKWYEEQKIESRCTFGERSDIYKEISYKAANDSAQISGYFGKQVIFLTDASMKKEEIYKIAQYFLFNEIDHHQDIVQWTAEFKGKVRYKVCLRFADKARTSVAVYEMVKGKIKSKPYAVIDYKDQIKEDVSDGKVRFCFDAGTDELESFVHPQLKKKVTGAVYSSRVVVFTQMTREQQERIAAAAAQEFVDETIKNSEDNAKIFLGMHVSISYFGEIQKPELFFVWDKNKDKLLRAEAGK